MTTNTVDEILGIEHHPPGDDERFGFAVLRPKWIHRTAEVTTRSFGR